VKKPPVDAGGWKGRMQLDERVERIERSMRRWRAGAVLATLGLACALASGAAKQPTITDEVNTRLLRVYDAQGKAVFIVGANEANEPSLRFLSDGKDAISAFSRGRHTSLQVHNVTEGGDSIDLMTSAVSADILLNGPDRGTGGAIGSKKGLGFITLTDRDGKRYFEKP
jgi:monomeric isocitrate dehydrogenase